MLHGRVSLDSNSALAFHLDLANVLGSTLDLAKKVDSFRLCPRRKCDQGSWTGQTIKVPYLTII